MQVQVLFPAPLAPVKGAVSELIRNDELAFLYAKTAPMPPLYRVCLGNIRLGLRHGAGLVWKCFRAAATEWGFLSLPPRIYRASRVRRVIRVRTALSRPRKSQIQAQIIRYA